MTNETIFIACRNDVCVYLKDCRAGYVVALRPCEARIKRSLLGVYESLCILAVDLHVTHRSSD